MSCDTTHPSSREHHDLAGRPQQVDDVIQRVDVLQLLALRWLRQDVDDDLPEREVVKVGRDLGVWSDELREKEPGVDSLLHLFLDPGDWT